MKFIVYAWGSNSDKLLSNKLDELGHVAVVFSRKCEHYTRDLKFAQELISLIHECSADALISNDYFPIISMVCNTVGIKYYSWVYDSPHYTLYAKTSAYRCNRIGCFDRTLVNRLNNIGIDTVFHLPLGVDWNTIIPGNGNVDSFLPRNNGVNKKSYACDISFVGSLYTGEYDYYDDVSDELLIKQKSYEFIKKQCFEYEIDYISCFFRDSNGDVNNELLAAARCIMDEQKLLPGDEYIEDIEYIFDSYFLDKKVTVEERRQLLTEVAGMGYDFRLYTGSDLSGTPGLKHVCRGYVDYYKEMPCVFEQSRINLNITLRSIRSGIPLRALDIMGCGGFLLSNYQEELGEYFTEGKEMVMFRSMDDCLEKLDYYLSHEDERQSIATAGRKAVRERFDYGEQLRKLIMFS